IGPNFAKSICGQGSKPGNAPPPVAAAAGAFACCAFVCTLPAMTDLTNPCTSSCVIRPLGPLPFTSSSGTPSSRASLRIDGEACGNAPVGAVGSCAGSAAVGDVFSVGAPAGVVVAVADGGVA